MPEGMRGTEQLAPEQKPRGRRRKRRGRAQLYRKKRNRPPGPTLDAMIKGAPAFMRNPAEFARARQARARKAMARRR